MPNSQTFDMKIKKTFMHNKSHTYSKGSTVEGPKVQELNWLQKLIDFMNANTNLLMQCAKEYEITNRLMASVKKYGLPKKRILYDMIVSMLPENKPILTYAKEKPLISEPCEVKVTPVVSPEAMAAREEVLTQIVKDARGECGKIYNQVLSSLSQPFEGYQLERDMWVIEEPQFIRVCDMDIKTKKGLGHVYYTTFKTYYRCNFGALLPPDTRTLILYQGESHVYKDNMRLFEWIKDLTMEGIEPNPGPRNKNNNNVTKNRKKGKRNIKPIRNANRLNQTVQKQREVVTLDYVEAITDYNNPGGPIVSGEYRFTDIYDIDPLILSRSVQFAQYMFDIYTYAKVISAMIVYTFDNLEQHALDIFTYHSTLPLLSSLGSRGQLESQAATVLCNKHVTMSEQYGKRSQVTLKFKLKSSTVLGNATEFRALDDFSCTSSSGPSRPLYTSWAVFSSAGTIPSGFSMRARIVLRVLYYNPRSIPIPIFLQKEDTAEESGAVTRLTNKKIVHGQGITAAKNKK